MKNILLIFLFISLTVTAQNLTFDECIQIKKSDMITVEEFLTSKNWKLVKASEPDDNFLGQLIFAYNQDSFSNQAESFIYFNYNETGSEGNRVSIELINVEKYNNYIKRIKDLGCKLISSEIISGEVVKFYQGKTTTIRIKVMTAEDNPEITKTHYLFTLYSNKEYDEIYGQ